MCWVKTSSLLLDSCCSMKNFLNLREKNWDQFLQLLVLELKKKKRKKYQVSSVNKRSMRAYFSVTFNTFYI